MIDRNNQLPNLKDLPEKVQLSRELAYQGHYKESIDKYDEIIKSINECLNY